MSASHAWPWEGREVRGRAGRGGEETVTAGTDTARGFTGRPSCKVHTSAVRGLVTLPSLCSWHRIAAPCVGLMQGQAGFLRKNSANSHPPTTRLLLGHNRLILHLASPLPVPPIPWFKRTALHSGRNPQQWRATTIERLSDFQGLHLLTRKQGKPHRCAEICTGSLEQIFYWRLS